MNSNNKFMKITLWITFLGTVLSFAGYKFLDIELLKLVGIGLGGAFANSFAIYFVLKEFFNTDFDMPEIIPERVK